MNTSTHLSKDYPGFTYKASELSAYTESLGIFIIGLFNNKTTHFEPRDTDLFEQWLKSHRIRDIRVR